MASMHSPQCQVGGGIRRFGIVKVRNADAVVDKEVALGNVAKTAGRQLEYTGWQLSLRIAAAAPLFFQVLVLVCASFARGKLIQI